MKTKLGNEGIVMKFYRVERYLYLHHCKLMAQIVFRIIYLVFNCYIPPSCELGKNVIMPHGIGIVLHHTCKIGQGTKIYQNVTVGGADGIEIGENCLLGANCVIYGKVKIGSDVNIGANTFVNFDVEKKRTVVGSKGHIIGE